MSAGVNIVAYGMVTAVGNSGPAAAAAMRAGVRGVNRAGLWDYTKGDYLDVGRPLMHQWWEGPEMLAELAAPTVEECAAHAKRLFGVTPDMLPVVLVLSPKDRPLRVPTLETIATSELAHRLGRQLPRGSTIVAGGRTGILHALEYAATLFDSREHEMCIVVGAESFLRQNLADHYVRENRLLTGANSNGFSPGEAAAAVLVVAPSLRYRGPSLAVKGSGRAHDPSGAGGNEKHPAKGDGLTHAIRQALGAARLEHRDIDVRVSDANGEHWKFKEAAFAASRLERARDPNIRQRRKPVLDHWHPTQYVGEIGAAIGPLMLGWILHAGQKGYLEGPRVLVHASEDDGGRAAILVEYRPGAGTA